MNLRILSHFVPLICATFSFTTAGKPLELLHEFGHVDYDWDAFPFTKEEAIKQGIYNPKKVTITGVKQWKDTLFATSPRWLNGVPTSLNTVVTTDDGTSVLRPFPSHDKQVIGDAASLQHIQSMEVDRRGWMWIIDVGRVEMFEGNSADFSGPPKLWIWDIEAHSLIHEYIFPDEIASHTTSFLNDIFVDDVKNVAYISEASGTGALLVYDYAQDKSRRWNSHPSLSFEEPLPPFTVEGNDINDLGPLPVDGLALAPLLDRVFYTPIHGRVLYSVDAALLRDFSATNEEIDASVIDHGEKASQCDGMTVSESGLLYMTMLLTNSVDSADAKMLLSENISSIAVEEAVDESLLWPDTFGWATDAKGGLLVTSARLEMLLHSDGSWPSHRSNTAIFRIPLDERSYQYALGPLAIDETPTVAEEL